MSKNVKFTKADLRDAYSEGWRFAESTMSSPVQLPKTSNSGCGRTHVSDKRPFKGSNVYGFWIENAGEFPDPRYVVFSYGAHYPMWIYAKATDQWFCNEDRYSSTTSKQQSQSAPIGAVTRTVLDTNAMKTVAYAGYNLFMLDRMNALGE
jgi:hypothetical protein